MFSLLALNLLAIAAPLPAPRVPEGPPPRIEVIQLDVGRPFLDGSDKIVKYQTVHEDVPVTVEKRVQNQVVKVVEYHTVATQVAYNAPAPVYLDTNEVQVFSLDGKRVEPAQVRKLLSRPTSVLVSTDGKPIPSGYLERERRAALYVVAPKLAKKPTLPPKSEP